MDKELSRRYIILLSGVENFTKTWTAKFLALVTVVGGLQVLGAWSLIANALVSIYVFVLTFATNFTYSMPNFIWVLIIFFVAAVIQRLSKQGRLLGLTSGAFTDDFRSGLGKWEFGGEGWKGEKEEGEWVLSVSESPDGGVTKKGLAWGDYVFYSEIKIICKNVGLILRAENRNKYIMVQLNIEDPSNPKLRLHYRREKQPDWIVIQETNVPPTIAATMKWLKVKIINSGSNIDVYIDNNHLAHYFIPDPIRFRQPIKEDDTKIEKASDIITLNYLGGKVGFRCSGNEEHAHIKRVRIEPISE